MRWHMRHSSDRALKALSDEHRISLRMTYKCDLLWRKREQVARQMFLIVTCTLSYDQYRHYTVYPMHLAKHNASQY